MRTLWDESFTLGHDALTDDSLASVYLQSQRRWRHRALTALESNRDPSAVLCSPRPELTEGGPSTSSRKTSADVSYNDVKTEKLNLCLDERKNRRDSESTSLNER